MSESRKLAISIIVMVVALAGVGTWLTFGMRRAKSLETSIDQKRRELATLQEKIAAVPELRQERQKLTSELDEYETILPNDREINKIYDTLSDFEKKSGIEIRVFTPMRDKYDNKSTASYKKISYEMDLAGDYFSLVRFLNLLENHNRFIQVDAFTVKQKEENNPINEISLRVSTFIYDPKSKPAATATRTARTPRVTPKSAAVRKAPDTPFDLKKELAARFVFTANTTLRDPFLSPLTRRAGAPGVETVKVASQQNLGPEDERQAVDNIEKKLAGVEPLIAVDKLDDAVKVLNECSLVCTQKFRDEAVAARALELSREWQRLDTMVRTARGEQLYRGVQETYEKMTQAFDAEDYDEVFKLRDSLDVLLGRAAAKKADARKSASQKAPKPAPEAADATAAAGTAKTEAPETERDPIHERLAEVVKACDVLVARAEIRKEFSTVAIRIQGTFWSGSGDGRKAAAIINGKMLSEGEVLKTDAKSLKTASTKAGAGKVDADIIVKRIDRDKVVFAYKDELIERSQYQLE